MPNPNVWASSNKMIMIPYLTILYHTSPHSTATDLTEPQ